MMFSPRVGAMILLVAYPLYPQRYAFAQDRAVVMTAPEAGASAASSVQGPEGAATGAETGGEARAWAPRHRGNRARLTPA